MNNYQALVAGQWISTSEVSKINNPSTQEQVATVASLDEAAINHAVKAARAALVNSEWATNGRLRSEIMLEWANRLEANVDSVAKQLTLENGKMLSEARFEVANQINVIRYNAGLARSLCGRSHSFGSDVMGVVSREPIGVVAVISPWNWPISLLTRDLAPALAAGNSVLCKPASQTAGCSVEFLRHLAECEHLPSGVLSILTGPGRQVGQTMVDHPDVDMIAFTGDNTTGKKIGSGAGGSLKKVALELGGKAPFIICADANLDKAVGELASAIFTTTSGQICTAPSRALIEESVVDDVVARLKTIISGVSVGDGFSSDCQMGPLTTRSQFDKVQHYIKLGKQQGSVVAGGEEITDPALKEGNFVNPVVFADLAADSELLSDEIFGPVLALQTFSNDEQAIEMANDSIFGLSAAVFTDNVHRAWNLSRRIQAGTVWVNTYNRFYAETEVGGYKESGVGRMAGAEGLHEFTQTKHINFDSSLPASGGAGRVSST